MYNNRRMHHTHGMEPDDDLQEGTEYAGSKFLIYGPRIAGLVSVVSAFLIMCIIFRSSTRLNSIYHRIMFGISIADFVASTAMALTYIPMPRPGISETFDNTFGPSGATYGDSPFLRLGNAFTCSLQGFFFVTGSSLAYAYNASLCWYYYSVIVKAMEEKVIRKRVEKYMHGIPASLSITLGLTFFSMRAYNPGHIWCTVVTLPWECTNDCETVTYQSFRYIVTPIIVMWALVVTITMVFCLLSVNLKINALHKILSQRNASPAEVEVVTNEQQDNDESDDDQQQLQQQDTDESDDDQQQLQEIELAAVQQHYISRRGELTRTRNDDDTGLQRTMRGTTNDLPEAPSLAFLRSNHLVANKHIAFQAFVYVFAILATLLIPIMRLIDTEIGGPLFYRLQILSQPLHGFFNFLIFIGFKIYHQRRLNPTTPYLIIVGQIFFSSTADPIFLSRITIVEGDGEVKGIEVCDQFVGIDHASLDHMRNLDDSGISYSESGNGISMPSSNIHGGRSAQSANFLNMDSDVMVSSGDERKDDISSNFEDGFSSRDSTVKR